MTCSAQVTYSSKIVIAANNSATASRWVKLLHQAVIYSNWIDQKLKEDLKKFEGTDITSEGVFLESDIATAPNKEIEILDNVPSKGTGSLEEKNSNKYQSSTDANSDRTVSPKLSNKKSEQSGAQTIKYRAATDFVPITEESKEKVKAAPKKEDIERSMTNVVNELDFKFDDNVNFQSFEILKQLGAGAFGKVYKVSPTHLSLALTTACEGTEERQR